MEPTAKLKLCNKKRWRNWITGGCKKGGWHRVSRIKEKRVREGKVEYNVAWTGWGRNQKDSWVSSDDVASKCIEAWEKAAPRIRQKARCSRPLLLHLVRGFCRAAAGKVVDDNVPWR